MTIHYLLAWFCRVDAIQIAKMSLQCPPAQTCIYVHNTVVVLVYMYGFEIAYIRWIGHSIGEGGALATQLQYFRLIAIWRKY